jgi:hypothetical protein
MADKNRKIFFISSATRDNNECNLMKTIKKKGDVIVIAMEIFDYRTEACGRWEGIIDEREKTEVAGDALIKNLITIGFCLFIGLRA